jgi:hypothetical protein
VWMYLVQFHVQCLVFVLFVLDSTVCRGTAWLVVVEGSSRVRVAVASLPPLPALVSNKVLPNYKARD